MIMREEDSNWFTKWEDELPPPEDLTPISQTLISTDLALAFDIQAPPNPHRQVRRPTSNEFDSSSTDLGGGGSAGADEPARTLKRPRLVWTPQLHKRFVDAVAHLGIKNAVPKTIMQLMSVDGLTRENVASHLQKYRLYLKRMQGIGNGGCSGGSGDPAADHLFASSPVPAHFLGGGAGGYVTSPAAVAAAIHHQQVAAMVAGGGGFQQSRGGQVGHFASPAASGGAWQFENPFVSRQAQMGHVLNQNSTSGYVEDFESGASANGRRVLTLFPTTG